MKFLTPKSSHFKLLVNSGRKSPGTGRSNLRWNKSLMARPLSASSRRHQKQMTAWTFRSKTTRFESKHLFGFGAIGTRCRFPELRRPKFFVFIVKYGTGLEITRVVVIVLLLALAGDTLLSINLSLHHCIYYAIYQSFYLSIELNIPFWFVQWAVSRKGNTNNSTTFFISVTKLGNFATKFSY